MEPARVDHRAREQHGEREYQEDRYQRVRSTLWTPKRMLARPYWASIICRALICESAMTRTSCWFPFGNLMTASLSRPGSSFGLISHAVPLLRFG